MSARDLDNVIVTAGDRNHLRWLRQAEADADPAPVRRPTRAELTSRVTADELAAALRFSGLTVRIDFDRDVLVIDRLPRPEAA
jgi:hypothetical protein